MYYIAYGSNMNIGQMANRCPRSKRIGTGKIKDWDIVFKYHADIVPSEGHVLPVLVWDIAPEDWPRLDRYEGYPAYYIRKTIPVTLDETGETFDAVVYVMTDIRGNSLREPEEYYFEIIRQGCEENGIDVEYLYDALDNARCGNIVDDMDDFAPEEEEEDDNIFYNDSDDDIFDYFDKLLEDNI